jgi:hypothetical protein
MIPTNDDVITVVEATADITKDGRASAIGVFHHTSSSSPSGVRSTMMMMMYKRTEGECVCC